MPGLRLPRKIAEGPGAAGWDVAYASDLTEGLNARLLKPNEIQDERLIASLVLQARPDVVIVPGWFNPAYRALAKNQSSNP